MGDFDIDITSDLGSGNDAHNADVAAPAIPYGSEPVAPRTDDAVNVNESEQAKPQEYSLRDQLSKAFTPDDKTPEVPKPDAAPAITQGEDGRWRRADGTFANADEVAALQKPAETNTLQEAPASILSQMTEAERRQVEALPAETREFLLRKMEAVEGQAARYSEYNLLESELLGPRRQAWQAQGLTPAVALQQLFAVSEFATRDPSAFVLWYADQHGVDLDAALDARDAQRPNDPYVAQLQQEVGQLRNTVSGFQQNQQQQVHQTYVKEVEDFALQKDASGNLARPYFAEVAQDFVAQIGALRNANPNMANADVLQKAYETACWANPSVRGRMQKAAEDARNAQAAEQARRASAASVSINGGPSGTVLPQSPENSNLSLREEITRQFQSA